MGNMEKEMKKVAEALTGKKADDIPDNLEDICSFIAKNYKKQVNEPISFTQVKAPADVAAAPTQEEFNNLIQKLKQAKIFI